MTYQLTDRYRRVMIANLDAETARSLARALVTPGATIHVEQETALGYRVVAIRRGLGEAA